MNEVLGQCSLCGGLVRVTPTGISCSACGAQPDLPVIPMQPAPVTPYVPFAPYTPAPVPSWAPGPTYPWWRITCMGTGRGVQ